MILDDIVAAKRVRLSKLTAQTPLEEIKSAAEKMKPDRRSFRQAIKACGDISIIGEIKRASPSKGMIREEFNPEILAKEYARSDVQALSVLTEQDFFLGCNDYLVQAAQSCHLPVLRKDFLISLWQIYESFIIGADAILLIVAILGRNQLSDYLEIASSLGMDALVEVHDLAELETAVEAEAQIIGINNRNLKDFSVSLNITESIIQHVPKGKIIVSESGIHSKDDVQRLREAGVHALLIGESLMRADNIPGAVKALRAV